ncbi:hypothetical protein A3Q56_08764, partial [Intoshia linei]
LGTLKLRINDEILTFFVSRCKTNILGLRDSLKLKFICRPVHKIEMDNVDENKINYVNPQMVQITQKYAHIFNSKPGTISNCTHKIELIGDHKVSKCPIYPVHL